MSPDVGDVEERPQDNQLCYKNSEVDKGWNNTLNKPPLLLYLTIAILFVTQIYGIVIITVTERLSINFSIGPLALSVTFRVHTFDLYHFLVIHFLRIYNYNNIETLLSFEKRSND